MTRLTAETTGLAGMPGGPALNGLSTLRVLAGYLGLFRPDSRRRLRQQPFLDLKAQHLRELFNCQRALGPQANEPAKDFMERMGQMEKEVARQEEEVRTNLDLYENRAINRRVLQK